MVYCICPSQVCKYTQNMVEEEGYLSEVKKRSNYVWPSKKKTTKDKLEEIRGYNYKSKKIKSPN